MSGRNLALLSFISLCCVARAGQASEIKEPNVAGLFYPADGSELSAAVDSFLANAPKPQLKGEVFALLVPHAGYEYSGSTAACGYALIKDKPYRTVVVIAPSHHYGFRGVSVYPRGSFRTPLGIVEVDAEFASKLLDEKKGVGFDPGAFSQEHALEVQLPFLQRSLASFKIVPVVTGDCDFSCCSGLAGLIKKAIAGRRDVLVVVSSDMYHGYDYEEAERTDLLTASYIEKMDAQGLYAGLRNGSLQMCGGAGAVVALILAKEMGHDKVYLLRHTTSAAEMKDKRKGIWTVGYLSCAIDREGGEGMFNDEQKKKLLGIARASIQSYLKTGKKMEVRESDPVLAKPMGAFVTLHEHGQLRGCIGNLVGEAPLYLTVRDMAVESAVADPRFAPVAPQELNDIEIEISVLSPMKKISSPDEIQMGVHGVLVRRGGYGGVYLPQVAVETGWSKEEFLSSLCAHKAGLSPDAWKDKETDIYVFTAEVFSEKEFGRGAR